MKKGLITIVVPTLNSKNHLRVLLASLEDQSYKEFEVILNDDKRATDNTSDLIKEYKGIIKVKYIQQNNVTAHGRKMGALAGEGEYVLHLDADMKLSSKVLEMCVKKMKQGYDALVIPEISYGEGFWTKVKAFERSMYVGDESIECVRWCRMSAYKAIDGHNEKMTFGEDKDFDIRLRKAGYKISRTDEPIHHNEGYLTLSRDLRKKFYYGLTANALFSTHPEYLLLYSNTIFRPAFFRNWRKLQKHPFLSMCMFFLKFLESTVGLLGLVYYRVSFKEVNKTKWR